jgi:hypothetical protein
MNPDRRHLRKETVERIVAVCGKHGIDLTDGEAYRAWHAHSHREGTPWALFAEIDATNEKEILEAVDRYLKAENRRRKAQRERLEIPGDWIGRDRALLKLAQQTGFLTINRLLTHVAYEVAYCKSPAVFYRALAQFFEMSRKRSRRSKK